jgi:hypothetical protein
VPRHRNGGASDPLVLARQPLILAALVLALAVRAEATTFFASGFDLCATPSSADTNYWSVVNGSPLPTTSVESTTGNLCAMRFDPASGGTEYLSPAAWAAQTSLRLSCRITPRSAGGAGCIREVASFVGSGGDWSGKGGLAVMKQAGAGVASLLWRAHANRLQWLHGRRQAMRGRR